MADFLNFIGGIALTAFSLVGAYIWLRWGWCGVQVIWANRELINANVQQEVLRRMAEQ